MDVTGTSKGHGYQGVIKRHGAQRTPTQPRRRPCPSPRWFHGLHHRSLPHLQGQDRRRPDGLLTRSPSRTWTSSRSIADLNLIAVRGAIPGPKGGLVPHQEHRQDPSRQARSTAASATTRRRLPVVIPRRLPPVISKERSACNVYHQRFEHGRRRPSVPWSCATAFSASSPIRLLCMKWSRTTWRIAVRARRAL